MRVRGSVAPPNAFTVEEQPDKPGFCLVRFYENVEPYQEEQHGKTIHGYEYDEYHLLVADYDGLGDDVLNNFDGYLAQAKLQEAETKTIPGLQQQVAELERDKAELAGKVGTLEAQVTDTQMALCDVYELAMGGGS